VGWLLLALFACGGESVSFEEPAAVEAPEGSARADEAPEPAEPDAAEGEAEAEAEAEAEPASRRDWPPVVIPGDQRERDWEWDFEYKGKTKREGSRSDKLRDAYWEDRKKKEEEAKERGEMYEEEEDVDPTR